MMPPGSAICRPGSRVESRDSNGTASAPRRRSPPTRRGVDDRRVHGFLRSDLDDLGAYVRAVLESFPELG